MSVLWIIEDRPDSVKRVAREFDRMTFNVCETAEEAYRAISAIADEDIVSVDSQFPPSAGQPPDSLAGQKFICRLRASGVRCRVFWHSLRKLESHILVGLGISDDCKPHFPPILLPEQEQLFEFASTYEKSLYKHPSETLVDLLYALQTYLYLSDLGPGAHPTLVRAWLVDGVRDGVDQSFPAQMTDLFPLEDQVWWFKEACKAGIEPWVQGDGLDGRFHGFLDAPEGIVAELCRDQKGWWSETYAPDFDGGADNLYRACLDRLWTFMTKWATNSRPPVSTVAEIDLTHRALLLVLLANFPFTKCENFGKRSTLNHKQVHNLLRICFQAPASKMDPASKAAYVFTEQVLKGQVPPGTYREIDDALRKWSESPDGSAQRVLKNIERIRTKGVSPFGDLTQFWEERFGRTWPAVAHLNDELIRQWLRIDEWAKNASKALGELNAAFEGVKASQCSMEELVACYERFKEAYSGRGFFNFQQTS